MNMDMEVDMGIDTDKDTDMDTVRNMDIDIPVFPKMHLFKDSDVEYWYEKLVRYLTMSDSAIFSPISEISI
jgi:hypothetical protein